MKKRTAMLGMIFVGTLAASRPSAAAATDIYMQVTAVPPISGEVTARGYTGQIQLLSFSVSLDAPVTQGSTGAGASAGRATCGTIKLTKSVDKASPLLMRAVALGEIVPEAVVSFVDTTNQIQGGGGAGRTTQRNDYTVTLTDVVFASFEQSDTSPAELLESVSLVPRSISVHYVPYDARGVAGSAVDYSFDCTGKPG